jgi:hypothetical protein
MLVLSFSLVLFFFFFLSHGSDAKRRCEFSKKTGAANITWLLCYATTTMRKRTLLLPLDHWILTVILQLLQLYFTV